MFLSIPLIAVILVSVYLLGLLTTPLLLFAILKAPTRLQKQTVNSSTSKQQADYSLPFADDIGCG